MKGSVFMPQKEHLAMASVPVQQWGPLYDKEEALRRGTIFQELNLPCFAAADLEQDTHPQDLNGLQMVKQMAQERRELLGRFAGKCYPLTFDCMADLYGESPDTDCYCWEKGPVPWEAVCG